MTKLLASFTGLFCATLATTPALADDLTLATILQQDGPYIDIPAGFEVPTGPPTAAELLVLTDLDGDPTVVTKQETEMLKVLMQVLIGIPLNDQFQLDPLSASDTQIAEPIYGGL